ncbi:MAG: DUF4190 domain-containing protein [Myxococcales bacterium]|nr:DUF4190 domain-containing protein [Myxococcales bacterium]
MFPSPHLIDSEAPIPDPHAPSPFEDTTAGGKTSGTAIAAFASSLLGFVCLPAVGGLLGLTLGIAARGEIARSQGRRGGRGLATAAIALGVLNVVISVVMLAVLITYIARPSPVATRSTPAPPPVYLPPPTPFPTPTATSAPPTPVRGRGAASRETGVVVTHVGSVDLVDVGRDGDSLISVLEAQRKEAKKSGEKLVLWVVADDCKPCNGVAAALPDPSMQRALGKLRMVRVNARDFAGELSYLNVPTDKIPGFALLGSSNRPLDYVHGGEWDEDVPKNIAPVMSAFLRGTYKKRRDPWHGGQRDDETPL